MADLDHRTNTDNRMEPLGETRLFGLRRLEDQVTSIGSKLVPPYSEKATFINERSNYCYEINSFGLKNEGATYQRLMDKVFHHQIGRLVEDHGKDLAEVFGQMCKYGMRLNQAKCTFGVPAGKYLGFMLTARGI
ncbi:uncharacterized protein LOC124847638 [Vigna umbellata]|uniref:uncharacterized protein LOC124847638 n=1 Tax=Vigna umbellata TaxID=87088 RepID=UPI001F5FB2BB|nr:uncharacterized protein LOC124847638 [Vigna umbellata]